MPTQKITKTLEIIISLHEELYKLSKEKTDLLMSNAVDQLQDLMLSENKYIQSLEHYEKKRQTLTGKWFASKDRLTEPKTLRNMIHLITDPDEQENLKGILIELTNKITQLKQQEQLNSDLIKQSLHFNQVMLDMIDPTIEQINYGGKGDEQAKRSVFDSQV